MILKKVDRRTHIVVAIIILVLAAFLFSSCRRGEPGAADDGGTAEGLSVDAAAIAEERGLTPADVSAALKTYMPTGTHDEYVMFASGGHSGQIFVIGVPSMRLLRSIAVFTPEPWQGWGYGEQGTMDVLAGGDMAEQELRWGDTHHPALSETDGEYDGEFLFIGDK